MGDGTADDAREDERVDVEVICVSSSSESMLMALNVITELLVSVFVCFLEGCINALCSIVMFLGEVAGLSNSTLCSIVWLLLFSGEK